VRPRPNRLEQLPEQYFSRLLTRVAEAAQVDGEPLVDLGRGNPDVPPPLHVAERLAAAAAEPTPRMHGYAPFRGVLELKEALAGRYATEYGVDLDPEREVAVMPGTKSALVELALALAEPGETMLLPDPGYPDYHSGAALASARVQPLPLDREAGWLPDFGTAPRKGVAAAYLNFPSNPCAVCAPPGLFAEAVRYGERTGAAIVHDFAYGDLVFDGRAPASFLATPGAKEVGVELFSMSKSYGMAGWRLGFVVGNAEIVARTNLLTDHLRAGIFRPVQEAGIAALTGPQQTVAERRSLYEARRERVWSSLQNSVGPKTVLTSEGTFYVWVELPAGVTPESLLAEQRVAVAPGEGFGARGGGFARLSLAVSDDALDLGLARLAPVFATAYAGRR
jgi:L-glutamine---4-(methylsulfanyl)-2-oxobutanoate aminotransferase